MGHKTQTRELAKLKRKTEIRGFGRERFQSHKHYVDGARGRPDIGYLKLQGREDM